MVFMPDYLSVILIGIIVILFCYIIWLHGRIENRARKKFDAWYPEEMQRMEERRREEISGIVQEKATILFERWQKDEEEKIRKDAIKRSHAVVKGRITEQFIPFLETFPYNPQDARFIGTPVDLIIFDGLSLGSCREVVFLEVKTGPGAVLSRRERDVRECIRKKNVSYQVFHTGQ